MADTTDIDIKHDGDHGFSYTISDRGVLIAKGWVRVGTHTAAIQLVRSVANLLRAERS